MSARRVSYVCLQATREGQAAHAHVNEIVAGLRARGLDVTLFEPEYGDTVPGAAGRMIEFIRVQRRAERGSADADLLYLRAHFALWPIARWARRRRIPVVQEVNGPYGDLFAAWPWTTHFLTVFAAMMRWQYRHAERLIAVSPALRDWLAAETGRGDVVVVPNGANVDLFRPDAPPMAGLPARYVVFFGALAPWQGVDTMLAAVRDPAWPEGVSLVVAGDGMLRSDIETAAAGDPRLAYIGPVPYAAVPGLVTGAIAGLSPKNRAGGAAAFSSPLKPFEILACGVPVIATDFPGQAAFVRAHDCGVVVPPEDPAALARAVADLAADPAHRGEMGARGRAAVVAEASWDARAASTAEVIDGLFADAPLTVRRDARTGADG